MITKIRKRIALALHNIIGHPLAELFFIFGCPTIGTFIHDNIFTL